MSSGTKIAIFYHVARMGTWVQVDAEIMEALRSSGLLDAADVFVRNECRDLDLFEFPTIEMLHRFAATTPGYAVLYIHTKGVSKPSRSVDDWRASMIYWTITRWRECLAKIALGYDAVGTTVIDSPIRHFQGNFWWATTEHLRRLGLPRDIVYTPTYDNQTERHKAEFWVLSVRAKVYQPYHHHRDPYSVKNPRRNYVGLPF